MDVEGRTGCSVYVPEQIGTQFIGCLVLKRETPHTRSVQIVQSITRVADERACDAVS
jgi:hypothetical protein